MKKSSSLYKVLLKVLIVMKMHKDLKNMNNLNNAIILIIK